MPLPMFRRRRPATDSRRGALSKPIGDQNDQRQDEREADQRLRRNGGGELEHVVGNGRYEDPGIWTQDQMNKDDREQRQKADLDEHPEVLLGTAEEIQHGPPQSSCGGLLEGRWVEGTRPSTQRFRRRPRHAAANTRGQATLRGQLTLRCENSHRITPSAIRPTRPFFPRSPIIAIMLVTTPPKNGTFAPTNNPQTIARARSMRPRSVNAPTQFFTVCNASMCVSPAKWSGTR